MLSLALWLKQNNYKADQVQAFLPSPMSTASAMYYSRRNPLKAISRVKPRYKEEVFVPKRKKQRDLHKAFLRYHDKDNWPILRHALKKMGRADLIGSGEHQLIPVCQSTPLKQGSRKPRTNFRTQHSRAESKSRTQRKKRPRRT